MRGRPGFALLTLANFFTGVFRGRWAYFWTMRIAQPGGFFLAGITALVRDSLAGIAAARAAFGFEPAVGLDEGLAESVHGRQEHLRHAA